jgi:hypothetical protein
LNSWVQVILQLSLLNVWDYRCALCIQLKFFVFSIFFNIKECSFILQYRANIIFISVVMKGICGKRVWDGQGVITKIRITHLRSNL